MMTLDGRDIALLRLMGKYRWLPYGGLNVYGSLQLEETIDVLLKNGYIALSRDKGYIRTTQKGYDHLSDIGYTYDMTAKRAYANSTRLRRRLETSKIMLTALRAGIDTARDGVDALGGQPVFLPSFELRAGEVNVMSNANCAGFGHFGDKAYMFHYVNQQNTGMYLINELSIFHRLSSVFARSLDTPQAMIFAGPSYSEIYKYLNEAVPSERNGKRGFTDFTAAYHRTQLPVHLLSCDETGAMQLALMRQPDYNARVARAAYKTGWSPHDEQIPYADGSVKGFPLVIAADMNIRRVQMVCNAARRLGRKRVMIAAFKSQLDSLLLNEFVPSDEIKLYAINRPTLDTAFPGEFSGFQLPDNIGEGDNSA